MRNIKLILSYDGSDFAGWQVQPGRRTVQETLEAAIYAVTQERIRCQVSGRTDAGVHALGQVVNFFTQTELPAERLVRAINAHLPADVVVRHAEDVPQAFDANHDARGKWYRYYIHMGEVRPVYLRRYVWHVTWRLDINRMQTASQPLLGRHDFRSFETEWPNRMSSVRNITYLEWRQKGPLIWLDIAADGFLYNMVRAIVGTIVNVGRGYWSEERVVEILHARDRRLAGPTAPPQGLFLMQVWYDEEPTLVSDEAFPIFLAD
ncbi:MAG: tRNA pseudouridine(38-40) synthase TruA [Gemmatales bacterium]|nr:tRNA pseudouridine(38-40) synthase TruA [Gemmatales bacterium]MDW8175448.1 tRNA pseudouridine(38-40) synthase TruA [Gemmatales bacterium]